ncbi:MAG: hypothetical protein M1831_007526 [Alyxoria varia]|nr:MAG: hypothetical protein M1831_007526 [Alyxoria varia]
MNDLTKTLDDLELGINAEDRADDWIDANLHHLRPRKRPRINAEELKKDLEHNFLTPSPRFDSHWLNKLQQRFDTPFDTRELFQLAPTQSRTVTRFTREGLEGRVTGYKEVTVPANSATAKNSTSILRKPANRADFVRGSSGYLPFTPGGLEGVEAVAAAEDEILLAEQGRKPSRPAGLRRVIDFGEEGGLLQVAPGFSRGLDFSSKRGSEKSKASQDVENVLNEESQTSTSVEAEEASEVAQVNGASAEEDSHGEQEDVIDSLLPVEFPALAPHGQLGPSSNQRPGKQWAHVVDVNRQMPNFRELVPEMAREWPFELDTFQKEAVYHLENNDSVFVAAHTSAGKTVVAEYAISLAAKHLTKAIYTSPIKALSNQKFRDFQTTFDDVGILTGDVQIRPEASCLIMTTEILRSMLYRGADLIRDVEYVIFDEVHYVNDMERGVVWEEVIIMLPEYVTLILLSATVPNTFEFASWVGRTKKKDIYVISTRKRPVPLQHYLWAGKGMHMIVDEDKKFLEKGWKEANDVLTGKDKMKAQEAKQAAQTAGRGANANQRGQRGGAQRGGPQQRGRGQPSQQGHGNIARTGRGAGRTTAAQDRTLWVGVVQHLRKEEMLPTCIFVFSKKRCEENADALANLDFCNATEKSAIHIIIERSVARLKHEDRQLPQIRRLRELLGRGVAVHHGGLLPIVKEMVELLFARTLVKVLFATETFAMGLNLPTRTVVFSGYRKHDGRSFRDLLAGEYTQMAGRAGRRGLDSVGNVIIVAPGADEAPPAGVLKKMMLGDPTKLRSQFRLTYNMILNLLRVEALKIEEMIKRSFSENATQALLPEHEKAVKLSEADLEKVKRESCNVCDDSVEECHQASMDYKRRTSELLVALLGSPVGRRMFGPKRVVVFSRDGIRSAGVLIREGVIRLQTPSIEVLEIASATPRDRQSSDLLPYIPEMRALFVALPHKKSTIRFKTAMVSLDDVESITQTVVKYDPSGLQKANFEAPDEAASELLDLCSDWTSPAWDEIDLSRVKDMAVREVVESRKQSASNIRRSGSLNCPDFVKHFGMRHDEWLIKENISQLRQLMSDQNLQLLPDYEQRISVLKDLGFIDQTTRVELKGKVACEINTTDSLTLTELLLDNVLSPLDPATAASLLSIFVFDEKTPSNTQTPTASDPFLGTSLPSSVLTPARDALVAISTRVTSVQIQHQVIEPGDSTDLTNQPHRFALMEVVYEWARGVSFARIMEIAPEGVLEGSIVRVIGRLDELLREVRDASRVVGDPGLGQKMETAREGIRRDICGTASLYM